MADNTLNREKIDTNMKKEILKKYLEKTIFKRNTPTGASPNPKNFDLKKNLKMNLIRIETRNLKLKT